jgi:tetratricopeptide (TPR) repeat protein
MKRITCALLFILWLGSVPGRADILCLKDGRILSGPTMQQADGGIEVCFNHGTVFVPADLILESIIQGKGAFVPKTDFEKQQVEKGLVPFQGRWMSPSKRDREMERFLKKRQAAIADEEKHRLWRDRRFEKTKHFEFEYTVPQHIFERYRDLMEAYFTVFSKMWNVRQPRAQGRLKVCFYIDRETFGQIGGTGDRAAGYFRFIPPMELNFYYDRLDPEFTEEVMFHETNHYLVKLLNMDFIYPHFPGESLAEYYGASQFDPKTKKITYGLVQEGRLTEIQNYLAAGKTMELERLIKTEGMFEHYNWGWSLVHFLMSDPKYQKKFQKFAVGLARGKDVDRISTRGLKTVRGEEILRYFKKQLGVKKKEDFKWLEDEWQNYVKEKLKLITPRGKEKAAVAAMALYPARPIRAKRLYREAIEEGSTNPITFHKYAELLQEDDSHEEAVRMWKRAIELDPINPQIYARMGRALVKEGDRKEGIRLMRLAMEIDPDYAWSIEPYLKSALKKGEKVD